MFSCDLRKNTLTVFLSGELDHRMAGEVRRVLDDMLEDAHVRRLVFDLRELEFMDSSGVGLVIGRYKRLTRRGGSVEVVDPAAHIDRIFQMSGVYQLVEKRVRGKGETI